MIPRCDWITPLHELARSESSLIVYTNESDALADGCRCDVLRTSINQLNRDFTMLRATNEAQSDYTAQAIHAFALVDTSDLPQRQNLGRDHSSSQAGTTASIVYSRGGLAPRVVRRVREHIEGNIEKRISVEALARVANLSVCYFVRAFKQSVGVTPHDYLIRRRVERTMQLLSGTDMSLSEIALAAGFADQSHCARRFRQHVGMSPRDYRWSRP